MNTTAIPAGTVVVAYDGSPSADRALDWAIDQALREGRELTLAHGVEPNGGVSADPATTHRATLDAMRDDAVALLTRARAHVTEKAPGLTVHECVTMQDPRVALVDLADQAATVVLGSRGRGPVRSTLLGSVGVAVTRHAHCPVVVLRPSRPGLVRHGVLVGIDGTQRSQQPLEFAYRQASLHGYPLTVMHVVDDWIGVVTDEARLRVAEAISGLGEKFPDVNTRTEFAVGAAGPALAHAGARMNLLVVGAHHGGRASTIANGSITSSVLEHATCPVAVVPINPG